MRRRHRVIAAGLFAAALGLAAAPAAAQDRNLTRVQELTPQRIVAYLSREAGTWESIPSELSAGARGADSERTGVVQTTRTVFGDGGQFRAEVLVSYVENGRRRTRVTRARSGSYSVTPVGGNRFSLIVQFDPDPDEERLFASRAGAGRNTSFAASAVARARSALRLETTATALDDGRLDLGDGSILVRRN